MQISVKVLDKILAYARDCACKLNEHCYNFEVCYNPFDMRYWFVRFVKVPMVNGEPQPGEYEYLCFDFAGNPLDCDPIFKNQEDEVQWYQSFIVKHKVNRL